MNVHSTPHHITPAPTNNTTEKNETIPIFPFFFIWLARRWMRTEYSWVKPVEKAQLTALDKKKRVAYARTMLKKPKSFWRSLVYIDAHTFRKTSSLRSQEHVGR